MAFEWSGLNILIVDDDSDLRDTVCDIFKRLGAKMHSAIDGKDALSQIENQNISIILCDLQMPVMDGSSLLKVLNEKKIKIPFVFLTGQSHFTEKDARALGATALIYKPFSIKDLTARVEHILSNFFS